MPRSTRRSAAPMRSSRSVPVSRSVPATRPAPTPAPAQPQQQSAPGSRGPGLFGQMAATAGGVAIGSAVGHTIGHAMTGGGSHGSAEPGVADQQQMQQQPYPQQQQQNYTKPCEFELQEFLQCSQTHDLSLCEGFNEVLKECRKRYGM